MAIRRQSTEEWGKKAYFVGGRAYIEKKEIPLPGGAVVPST